MPGEFCGGYGYERKYAIKILRDHLPAPTGRKRPEPRRPYAPIEPVVSRLSLPRQGN